MTRADDLRDEPDKNREQLLHEIREIIGPHDSTAKRNLSKPELHTCYEIVVGRKLAFPSIGELRFKLCQRLDCHTKPPYDYSSLLLITELDALLDRLNEIESPEESVYDRMRE